MDDNNVIRLAVVYPNCFFHKQLNWIGQSLLGSRTLEPIMSQNKYNAELYKVSNIFSGVNVAYRASKIEFYGSNLKISK